MNNKRLILTGLALFVGLGLAAQSFTVSGTISDENGETIPSAIVVAKADATGTRYSRWIWALLS